MAQKQENTPDAQAPSEGTPRQSDFSDVGSESSILSQIFGFDFEKDTPTKEENEAESKEEEPVEEEVEAPEAPEEQEGQEEEKDFDNDAKRAAYWQSQHDKLYNDYKFLAQQALATQSKVGNEQDSQAQYELPPAPEPPTLPTDYNFSDAINNQESSSAKYEIAKRRWDVEMHKWNQMRTEYSEAMLQSELGKYKEQLTKQEEARQREAAYKQQYAEYINQIKTDYGKKFNISDEDALKIVTDMSQPEAYNLDNVVTLWMIKNGRHPLQQKQTPSKNSALPKFPNKAFEQIKKAQAVPPTMGVHTAKSEAPPDENDMGKNFMDMIIKHGNAGVKI